MLVKMNKEPMRKGKPYDEYRCFYIKDFNQGDCIRLKLDNGSKIRAIVTEVDLNNLHIVYKTSSSEGNRTTINKILTLESYVKDWLT